MVSKRGRRIGRSIVLNGIPESVVKFAIGSGVETPVAMQLFERFWIDIARINMSRLESELQFAAQEELG